MIKINLLAQRKVKRADKGQQTVALGFLIILLAGALVFLLIHRPLNNEIDRLKSTNKKLAQQNADKKKQLEGLKELEAAVEALNKRKAAIESLNGARATPADLLYELSKVMTPGKSPTMTKEMAKRVEEDPHRKLTAEWDPKHVWITKFEEKGGKFKLNGGAQSDGDMTQLAKRLEASVYFGRVVPEGGKEKEEGASGVTYYDFTITGKVVY
jgi:type IV pilus assembly protein PilN